MIKHRPLGNTTHETEVDIFAETLLSRRKLQETEKELTSLRDEASLASVTQQKAEETLKLREQELAEAALEMTRLQTKLMEREKEAHEIQQVIAYPDLYTLKTKQIHHTA